MDQVITAAVSSIVSIAIKELYGLLRSSIAAEYDNVGESLLDLYSSYKKIGDILLAGLDCWTIPAISAESQCWHDLVMCWYETEDLIDLLTYSVRQKHGANSAKKQPLPDKTSSHKNKIMTLRKKLDKLGELFQKLLPKEAKKRKSSSLPPGYRRSLQDIVPFVDGTARDNDKQTIIHELITHKVGVSIVGGDGLGKTTLARIIAQDESVRLHFPVIFKVSVSGDLEMKDVVYKLRSQKTKNILILLDDFSNVTDGEWEIFRCKYLDCESRIRSGCKTRILTTTRNPKVAELTGSFAHYLDQLKDDDCAKIIKEKSNVSRFNSKVWDEDISKIAKKCMGMPLIASKFGLTLLRKTSENGFQRTIKNLRDTGLWDLVEFREIFPCFKLNSPKLPLHVVRCFAYCSLFAPGHRFTRNELVQLWKAEGLKPSGSLQCFDDMLQRSIFRPLELCNDKEQSYIMQDLNYYFAQLLASEVFLRIDGGKNTNSSPSPTLYTRHMSLSCQNVKDDHLMKDMEGHAALRTILLMHQRYPIVRSIDHTFFNKLQGVRVLDLSYTNLSVVICTDPGKKSNITPPTLSGQTINLAAFKLLRYLDLSGNKFTELPNTIDKFLCALQVLKLKDCRDLKGLPDTLSNLTSLTHLYVNMSGIAVPPNLGKLKELEVLTSYRVKDEDKRRVSELGTMKHLRELHITDLNEISDRVEARKSNLGEKNKLNRLTLEWRHPHRKAVIEEDVLKGLEPSADLENLTVRYYNGKAFPAWFSNESKKLVSISLEGCRHCVVLPSLRQLPLLKSLALRYFDSLENVNDDFCATDDGEKGFPRLEKLEFKCFNKLVSWVKLDANSMPRLQSLGIDSCPLLQELPSLEHQVSLVNLEITNAPRLKALPELPSSMNGDNVILSLHNCSVLKETCQRDKADWEKIKNIRDKRNIFDNFKNLSSPA